MELFDFCAASPPAARAATTIKLTTGPKEEVPVPKVRRVLPEHEGKYKVTMPAGTTARSRKLLQKQGKGGRYCAKV